MARVSVSQSFLTKKIKTENTSSQATLTENFIKNDVESSSAQVPQEVDGACASIQKQLFESTTVFNSACNEEAYQHDEEDLLIGQRNDQNNDFHIVPQNIWSGNDDESITEICHHNDFVAEEESSEGNQPTCYSDEQHVPEWISEE